MLLTFTLQKARGTHSPRVFTSIRCVSVMANVMSFDNVHQLILDSQKRTFFPPPSFHVSLFTSLFKPLSLFSLLSLPTSLSLSTSLSLPTSLSFHLSLPTPLSLFPSLSLFPPLSVFSPLSLPTSLSFHFSLSTSEISRLHASVGSLFLILRLYYISIFCLKYGVVIIL
ncbi:unnamed protein product [Acanthosepion pharaonis]|uniref:Uncharacterized protein n=1 Tax=Acanthosepion pharaonis TaxID=158019 RepID=A0A812D8C6_ACAPH|nr:unnamed protein product [Sepia pharaonis]